MNRLRGPIGMISAWLLVVAVGSAMVWTVISRAGDDLLPAGNPSFQATSPAAQQAAATPAPNEPQETAKPSVIRSKEPAPPTPSPQTPSESVPPTDATTPPDESTRPPGQKGDEDKDKWRDGDWDWDRDNSPPAKVRGTWQGTGGVVVAECVGWKISLIGAPANSGYHVDVRTFSDRGIRVLFEPQDASGPITVVYGKCYNGKPIFFDRVEDGSGDDGNNSGE